MGGSCEHGAAAAFGTSAAGLGASRVARPAGDTAVDGASLGVAHTGLLGGACVTAVLGSDVDGVGAGLDADTTGLGAGSPGVPGVLAVDRARVGVAVLLR